MSERRATRVERFMDHLDELSGGAEPQFFPVESSRPELERVTVIAYEDLPEPGMITAMTYGLSLVDHPEWTHGKPELCLSVQSDDPSWAVAMGQLADSLRGECPFAYGDTIDVGEPIVEGSALSAWVVFAPAVLDREDFLDIDVGDKLPLNICGVYPIHEVERAYIEEHGLEDFWRRDWDLYDVARPPAV